MTKRIVLKDLDTNAHYKINVASTYNGDTMKDFVLRAIKYYIATQPIPRILLIHPTLAPLDLQGWLTEYPGVDLNVGVFTAPNGTVYTTDELIELAKTTLLKEGIVE